MYTKRQGGEVPVLLTEHGFNSINAAEVGSPFPSNGGTHDVGNQARIVAQQVAHVNAFCKKYKFLRGMCFFQWLDTYYKKCGVVEDSKALYANTCTEGNFGQVEWNEFGALRLTPTRFGKTKKNSPFPSTR